MNKSQKYYKIIDPDTGDVLCSGDSEKCAVFFGVSKKCFQNSVGDMIRNRRPRYKGYCIEVKSTARKQQEQPAEVKSAIKAWNDFTEPLRRKYGIPVYQENRKAQE